MNFTYKSYIELLNRLRLFKYENSNYFDWSTSKKPLILRHDIDYDIKKALKLAEIEANQGFLGTYFVLLTSDFYNVFSRRNIEDLKSIEIMGHTIGLHFDEMNYPEIVGDKEAVVRKILKEAQILENALEIPIRVVSMHRPSKEILQDNLEIPGMINSYSETFFRDFKYLSDSRRRWREPVEEIVSSNKYNKLHILTHAFWYNEVETSLKNSLNRFLEEAEMERYNILSDNFTNLDEALGG